MSGECCLASATSRPHAVSVISITGLRVGVACACCAGALYCDAANILLILERMVFNMTLPKNPWVIALGVALSLYMVNWLFVYIAKWPILYCAFEPVVSPVYWAWANLVSVAVIAYLVWQGIRKQWIQFMGGCGILMLVLGAPQFADSMFKMGGTCL